MSKVTIGRMAEIQRAQLTSEESWKCLQTYFDTNGKNVNILQMFKEDPKRFEKFRYVFKLGSSCDRKDCQISVSAHHILQCSDFVGGGFDTNITIYNMVMAILRHDSAIIRFVNDTICISNFSNSTSGI